MKDENIKEILDKINCALKIYERDKKLNQVSPKSIYFLSPKEQQILLDYITNLQEENEIYKKELEKADSITQSCIFEGSRSAGKSYRQCLNWLEDYKSRIDKAIDKIQYIIDYGFDYDGFNTVESLKGLIDMLVDYARQSKDILQGSDKDE